MNVTKDIRYIGVNDHQVDLFEGQYKVPLGMAYNSYVILDRKIAVMDTVDQKFTRQWLTNPAAELGGRQPDYLVVQHMEPDHSANIKAFMDAYPDAVVVSSAKAFPMMGNFFGTEFEDRRLVVKEGDALELGEHTLHFVQAPMVHWPEVIMTYDAKDKVLFSADGFGKFGANDVVDPKGWDDEARRYYIGIVGKYGPQVQSVLKKAATLDIQIIAPLHGPVLTENLGHYLKLYQTWSSYGIESDGILVAYTSVYGHTKAAVELLARKLKEKGCPKVVVADLARMDLAECVAYAFQYGRVVLATTTYNAEIYPFMRNYIQHLTERNFQKRTVAFIENGSWAPLAGRIMKCMLEGCKNLTFADTTVHLRGGLNADSEAEIEKLATELCKDYLAQHDETANKSDLTALFKIGYGLYVVTARDGDTDNGCIVNTVTQVTNTPNRIAVCINKANYTHELVQKTGVMNVNCLSVEAPFSVFQHFGFQSGRTVNKFADGTPLRSDNGVIFLDKYINAFMSLKVEQYVDLDTHGMFICTVEEARVLSSKETVTYNYYQANIKPRPDADIKKGWVCKVCGYIYDGEVLPDDYICPLCKHGAADFEQLG